MFKNILANWSNVIVSIIAVFILYPFFLKTLGEEQYGVWLLISSATGYFSLLQMGVPMANVRFLSKYSAKRDYNRLNEVVCTNLFFFSIGALLILILGFVLAIFLDVFFQIPAEFVRLAKIATLLVCLEISIRFVFEVFEGFFHAKQKFVIFNIIKNLMVILRIGVTYYLVQYENGLLLVALVILLITSLQSLIFYFYIRLNNPNLKLHYKFIKISVLKEIFGYSIFVLIFQLSSRIGFRSDALVLGSIVSVSSIVWFNAANNLLMYFSRFLMGISQALMPKISVMESSGLIDSVGSVYLKFCRFATFLVIPTCLSFWFFGGDFIALWLGEEYREVSGKVLSILTIGYYFYLVQSCVAIPILMGISKIKLPTIIMFIFSIVNLVLSVIWGYSYGIYGVAWGTTVPISILSFFLLFYVCKTLNVNLYHYIDTVFFKSIICSITYILVFFIVSNYINIDSYMTFIISLFFCIAAYSFISFFTFLTKDERIYFYLKFFRIEVR